MFPKMLFFFCFLMLLGTLFYVFVYENFQWKQSGYRSNPDLLTVRADWKGTPINADGRFLNENPQPLPGFGDMWRWQTEVNPQKEEKKNDNFRLKVLKDSHFLSSDEDCVVWLGHATFFIRLNGVTFLTDPIFDSPSFLMKRYSELPIAVEDLKNIDYIIVSHDHRDHCDESSLKKLATQNPNATYLTGLGLDKLLHAWTYSTQIQSVGWYQQYQTDTSKIEVIYLPARHWGRRFLNDTNRNLWGAYLIRANGKSIYFGADSGYGTHYQDFRKYFPPPDVALIGVGAFRPEWFMGASHQSPADAVKAAQEIGTKKLIPMHYGTFDLSDEPLGEPYRELQRLQQNHPFIHLADVGEVVVF
ncbi:MAG: MBL fold metallo-hydrolase [Runella sp.]